MDHITTWPSGKHLCETRSEGLAALGLILPSITRLKPGLTVLAALGLVVIMILAALFHASRGKFAALPINATLGALAAFVAWGRRTAAPIAPIAPRG